MKVHYLIVGQGLAGSILAWQLIQHEQTVLVVDNEKDNSASKVAAGLINPITGQRLVKSREVDTCLPYAINFYQELAVNLGQQFYFPVPMLRLFRSRAEIDRYKNRCKDAAYHSYLGESYKAGESGDLISDSLGSFVQHHTGYLAITELLTALRAYFNRQGAYLSATFNASDLTISNDAVQWKDYQADNVIFCEGSGALDNPWFRWLPFQLSKGEILAVHNEQMAPKKILNDGHWLLPTAEDEMKVGATYEWEWADENPSSNAKHMLLTTCERITGIDEGWSVTDHKAGIRPTTKDKNPFIGFHPQQCRLSIFNGFGSKGSMLIPFYASRFVDLQLRGLALPQQVDIRRFEKGVSQVTLAKRYVSETVNPGDIVIDATVGNGHDTEFLARCVGAEGKVYGFDIQQEALTNASKRLLGLRLNNRVTLYNADHKYMQKFIDCSLRGKVAAITFNLGYLPGNVKEIKTQSSSTITALNMAIQFLKPTGIITIISYVGHKGGTEEANNIQEYLREIANKNLKVVITTPGNAKGSEPVLIVISKNNDKN